MLLHTTWRLTASQAVELCLPSLHPTGVAYITLTRQVFNDRTIPYKRCPTCKKSLPVLCFVDGVTMDASGYGVLGDKPTCHLCKPPPPFLFVLDENQFLRMRMALHNEAGAPLRWFDQSTQTWCELDSLGLRLMQPGGNRLRVQPYSDRTSRNGNSR
jgi:hypothetical protein